MQTAKCVSFSATPEIFESMSKYCAERGCTRSWLVSKAISQYLAECEEDREDYEIACKAWEEFVASGEKMYDAESVFAEAGL